MKVYMMRHVNVYLNVLFIKLMNLLLIVNFTESFLYHLLGDVMESQVSGRSTEKLQLGSWLDS